VRGDPELQVCKQPEYLVIAGPTASGKSALAMDVAERFGGEIINCDSVQMYRGFDIGSAKPTGEERDRIVHHLLDVVSADEDYDARCFAEAAEALISELRQRGKLPIVVGGTGLYLRALWRDNWHDLPKSEELRSTLQDWSHEQLHEQLRILDPQRAAALHQNDRFRLQRAVEIAMLTGKPMSEQTPGSEDKSRCFAIRVSCERSLLWQRSAARVALMLKAGLIDEVRQLLQQGVDPQAKPMQSIGYAQVVAFLQGRIKETDLPEQIHIATRQYAKKQETWFKKVAFDAIWLSGAPLEPLYTELSRYWPLRSVTDAR
jgi:tRNA dimethylallyltransferase